MTLRLLGPTLVLALLAGCEPGTAPSASAPDAPTRPAPPAEPEVLGVGAARPDGGGAVVLRRSGAPPRAGQLTSPEAAAAAAAAARGVRAQPGEGGPQLVFAQTSLDLGVAWETDTLEGRFEFTNAGDGTLVFGTIKPSCGCTTTALERLRYEPGEGGELSLAWKPKGFGDQTKTIAVSSNATGAELVVLQVSARIRPFARFEPRPLALGEREKGRSHTARVELSCVDPEFELLELVSSTPHLTAVEVGRGAAGTRVLELTLDGSAPWGLLTATLHARIRGRREGLDLPVEHTAELPVSATLVGDLRAEPAFFAVGRVAPQGRVDYSVRLTSRSGTPFRVVEARVEDAQPPGLSVRCESQPDGSVRLVLEGDVGEHLGLIRAHVWLTTDLPGEEPRRLAVQGIVR